MLDLTDRPAVASRPWLAQYDPGVPATLHYPDVRIDELLSRSASRYPDRPATVFLGRQTSYRRLDEAVDLLASGPRQARLSSQPGVGTEAASAAAQTGQLA